MSQIKMSFDPEVARAVGTDAAIILSNIQYWTAKNRANKKNLHDGRYWTYNSMEAFSELFDYLTPRQIRTCLQKLQENGYIVTGEFNKNKYDRTKWYSTQLDLTEMSTRLTEKVEPIPNNKPNNKPNADKSAEGDEMGKQVQAIIKLRRQLKWKTPYIGSKREGEIAHRLVRDEGYTEIVSLMKAYNDRVNQDKFLPGVNNLADFEAKLPMIRRRLEDRKEVPEWM